MPVPSDITALSTTAASNSPPGSETPSSIDDYLRSHASFIAQIRAVIGGAANPLIPSGNGTAAAANLTTSATDTTAGRATKVGDYGLGATSTGVVLPALANADTNTVTGFFICTGATLGVLPTSAGSLMHVERGSSNMASQVMWGLTGTGLAARKWSRTKRTDGIWDGWRESATLESPSFTGTPSVPTAAPGTNTTQAASTAFVLANPSGLGIGQTWQDVTASRALATSYTNSTGKPIQVSIGATNSSAGTTLNLTIAGVIVKGSSTGSTNYQSAVSAVVPNGATYSASYSGGTPASLLWSELR